MNKVILIGRFTRDPELKTTQGQNSVCSFTLAVSRNYTNSSGTREADFINCVAWRKTAETIVSHFKKGNRIAIVGKIESRSYDDKDGKKVYVTEVAVDEFEFVDSKGNLEAGENTAPSAPPQTAEADADTNSSLFPPPDDGEGLPFDL